MGVTKYETNYKLDPSDKVTRELFAGQLCSRHVAGL
jgi:hypothetical protein